MVGGSRGGGGGWEPPPLIKYIIQQPFYIDRNIFRNVQRYQYQRAKSRLRDSPWHAHSLQRVGLMPYGGGKRKTYRSRAPKRRKVNRWQLGTGRPFSVRRRGRTRGGRVSARTIRPQRLRVKEAVFPSKLLVKLPAYTREVSDVSITTGELSMTMNDILTPAVTRAGLSNSVILGLPRGWNQWKALYNRYRVVGYKVIGALSNRHPHDIDFKVFGMKVGAGRVNNAIEEDFYSSARDARYFSVRSSGDGTHSNTRYFSRFFSIKKYIANRNKMLQTYLTSAGPTDNGEEVRFQIVFRTSDQGPTAASTGEVLIRLRIIYYIEFSERLAGVALS